MLIIVSDLHFTDGTAGENNFPARAVKYFLDDIFAIATKPSNNIKEIKLVFLGDIFDLLRTEKWFSVPEDERPWGKNEAKIEAHANAIFDAIMSHGENPDIFGILGSNLQEEFELPFDPERIYIPGNHDRLCNKYQSLREKICHCLSLNHDPKQFFGHFYPEIHYGLLARHGHEYDRLNYAGEDSFDPGDYIKVPIGDPITTELVSRLPYALDHQLEKHGYGSEERHIIKRNFQDIDNVRPLSAVVEWLLYQVKMRKNLEKNLEEIIKNTIYEVIKDFTAINYVKSWFNKNYSSTAICLRIVLRLLRKISFFWAKGLLSFMIKLISLSKDPLQENAPNEFRCNPYFRYVVYGHTHESLIVPLMTVQKPSPLERVYANSGTWRARHFKATQDNSFINWKNMTYVIFYQKGERKSNFPLFETWTGTLKT